MPEAGLSFGTTSGFHIHGLADNVGYINVYIEIVHVTGGGLKTSATDKIIVFYFLIYLLKTIIFASLQVKEANLND